MALLTGGTSATTSLAAIKFIQPMNAIDFGNLRKTILDDINPAHPIVSSSFAHTGLLYVPNRGVLQILPGDYVMVDATTGWPILISARAIAAGPWAHS